MIRIEATVTLTAFTVGGGGDTVRASRTVTQTVGDTRFALVTFRTLADTALGDALGAIAVVYPDRSQGVS